MNLALVAALAGAIAMPQPWGSLYQRDHIMVLGGPGSGKTPFAAELVDAGEEAHAFGFREVALRAVFWNAGDGWEDRGEWMPAAELTVADLEGPAVRLVVEPEDGQLVEDFCHVVSVCREAREHGGLVLLVDEVGDLTDQGAADALRTLHRNGHKDGLATVMVSPCWTDFPARCRSTASRVFCFHQRAEADIAALNAELGRQVPDFGELAAAWRYPAPPVAWRNPTLHR